MLDAIISYTKMSLGKAGSLQKLRVGPVGPGPPSNPPLDPSVTFENNNS